MKNIKLQIGIRLTIFLCGIILIFVLFNPIWRIELNAPQYPEGLMMTITARGLSGDVAIINGLNHYIGMKSLHNEDFIEFTILPYIIILFGLSFFIVAIVGKQKPMYFLFALFTLFGIIAMIDFWKWEYNYGHNLDPNAPIIVPGMSYQPPLIGFKQLLNFGAYSVPDIGGWLFVVAGVLLLICIIIDYRTKRSSRNNGLVLTIAISSMLSLQCCTIEPESIRIGSDNCHYCKMLISDNRFGTEVITKKGKVFKYDESHCLLSEISSGGLNLEHVKDIYFTDFGGNHQLIKQEKCFFLKSDELKAPMGGNIAAFSSLDSLTFYKKHLNGEQAAWTKIISAN